MKCILCLCRCSQCTGTKFLEVVIIETEAHPFAICVFIFHKTEVLTVILRCLTGLNLDWVKSYGIRCSLRPCASSANSQKIATDK